MKQSKKVFLLIFFSACLAGCNNQQSELSNGIAEILSKANEQLASQKNDMKSQGTVFIRGSVPFADNDFLAGILDLNKLKDEEQLNDWPLLLDNSFIPETNSGEIRMIPPKKMFSFAKYFNIDTGYKYYFETLDNTTDRRLIGLYIQRISDRFFLRAFYFISGFLPEPLYKHKIEPVWYNNNLKRMDQVLFSIENNKSIQRTDFLYDDYWFSSPVPIEEITTEKEFGNFHISPDINLLMITVLSMPFSFNGEWLTKEKQREWRCNLLVYPFKEIIQNTYSYNMRELIDLYDDKEKHVPPVLLITSSQPLVEEGRPFRYTIDRAFDGNINTSYVENTTNDLFSISFEFAESKSISVIILINGFAENESLYYKNNRIKSIQITTDSLKKKFTLKDQLTYQACTFGTVVTKKVLFEVLNVYPGSEWNDTCLSEFDFIINGRRFFSNE